MQINAFKSGRNPNGDHYADDDYNIMGEILSMQPVSTTNEENIDYDVNIVAAGFVAVIDRAALTFLIHVKQYVASGDKTDDMSSKVVLKKAKNGQILLDGFHMLNQSSNSKESFNDSNLFLPPILPLLAPS
ncbi:hypothetical protein EI94DRAFT_1699375 [Lactarius quietus]|nr:hypothetical protein EI94DRAFT_1699375 [Lactarius quietus]